MTVGAKANIGAGTITCNYDGFFKYQTVIGAGALSGMWLGLFVGVIFSLFDPQGFQVVSVLGTVAFGAVFGAIWAVVGYKLTRGERDFTSVSQVVAAKYEVLCEHKHVAKGRELLTQMDPMRAAQQEVRRAQEAEQSRMASHHPTSSTESPGHGTASR